MKSGDTGRKLPICSRTGQLANGFEGERI